jgi:hypothetical protein
MHLMADSAPRCSCPQIKNLRCGSSMLRIGWFCKLFIGSALGGGSSGWTRTSNPPVNSAKSAVLPRIASTCGDAPDQASAQANNGECDDPLHASKSRSSPLFVDRRGPRGWCVELYLWRSQGGVRRFFDKLHGAVAFRSPHHVFELMQGGLHEVAVPSTRGPRLG